MENLRFGTTARRRARRRQRIRRLALLGWAVSTLGVLLGAPVTRATAVNVLEQISLRAEASPAPAITVGGGPLPGDHRPPPDAARSAQRRKKALPGGGASTMGASRSIETIITAAAERHGLDGDYLVSVAACESGLDPDAYNSAGYHGLFQYDESTWDAYGEGSIWDPAAQAETTAMLIADGQSSRWPNCA